MLLAMLEVVAGESFGGVGACCTRTTAWRTLRDARPYAERRAQRPRHGRAATPGADCELELLVAPAPPLRRRACPREENFRAKGASLLAPRSGRTF